MIHKNLSFEELPPLLSEVFNYWVGHNGEKLGCSWATFGLDQMPFRVLPYMMVFDVMEDISQNLYRFCGTGMLQIHGRNMTGKTISELNPRELARAVINSQTETVNKRSATASVSGFERADGFAHMEHVLRLPLSNNGTEVDHIVTVVDFALERLAEFENNQLPTFK